MINGIVIEAAASICASFISMQCRSDFYMPMNFSPYGSGIGPPLKARFPEKEKPEPRNPPLFVRTHGRCALETRLYRPRRTGGRPGAGRSSGAGPPWGNDSGERSRIVVPPLASTRGQGAYAAGMYQTGWTSSGRFQSPKLSVAPASSRNRFAKSHHAILRRSKTFCASQSRGRPG
jgi:hypothetical protein